MQAERVRAFAPGRVNLIGEHTDYNEGLCLPFAIERGVTVTAQPLDGREIVARASDLGEEERFELGQEERRKGGGRPWAGRPRPAGDWRRFVRGAAGELRVAGRELRPCELTIAGDVPRGAGLASSAALSLALCLALCAVAGAEPPGELQLAELCSRVENSWVGQHTGLLDQLASLHGERGAAVRIDMRGPQLEPIPLDLGGARLATLDSGAPRDLAVSGYNRRRAECEEATLRLGVHSLRDATQASALALPQPLAGRVRHVVSENGRVEAMVAALRAGEPLEAGRLLDASHASLRDDYECSVPAVEETVTRAKAAGAVGARMVGGGFGGHVLALFPPGAGIPQRAFEVTPGPGARLL